MKVLYIYRSVRSGPSIRRVFEPIENVMSNYAIVNHVDLPWHRMKDFLRNMIFIISVVRDSDNDIIHVTGDVYYILTPLWLLQRVKKNKIVVTVHDLGHYTQHKHTLMHFFYYWLWIKPIKLADYVTFISMKSCVECQSLIELNSDKITVINNPYKEDYVYTPTHVNPKPRILHIGTGPNKNIENVIKALNGVPCHLRIIKKLSENQHKLLNANNIDYSNAYDISDEQMLEEYKQCDVVSFPSLYEGFGLPIIEGQAVGRVVVTSKREPMKSVAGSGAILVDPEDIDDIRRGFLVAMKNPGPYIEKGLENCKRFSSGNIANHYYEIYKELCGYPE